ncbi:dTDP-4-dehydrorhamnose 3,5-epimerase [Peribacillus asahii]|uniref:dTDP-4-dehydrorhamnose 3,5-epimerase n=1 Tax=Peribacillus asahii TaxID=228899 RepID=UPI00207B074E|nr:dTDP-4-dehydrorhamnose 3,5-epimerase [Peribacillus asahii]USK68330.1 dTDP-4-dehydrorhamnose 3,5-epimerase [Peribacillus asahii]
MDIIKTKFEDVVIIVPTVYGDQRGFFMETYNSVLFREYGIDINFVQDNHSLSEKAGTLRGLHYQLNPKAQMKLVRVTSGAIFDVVVDIRKGSPTYGQWGGYILTAENKRQLLIPKGFAHGFCTLVDNTEVQYKVDELYSSPHDRGIIWNDPSVGVEWPVNNPLLSEKDKQHPTLENADNNFELGVTI